MLEFSSRCRCRAAACLDIRRQIDQVDALEDTALQGLQLGVLPQLAAPVENRVALAPRGHQAGIGQHLQVVTEGRLADIEDGAQLGHTKGILAQYPQHLQAQGIGTGFAQVGKRQQVLLRAAAAVSAGCGCV